EGSVERPCAGPSRHAPFRLRRSLSRERDLLPARYYERARDLFALDDPLELDHAVGPRGIRSREAVAREGKPGQRDFPGLRLARSGEARQRPFDLPGPKVGLTGNRVGQLPRSSRIDFRVRIEVFRLGLDLDRLA